MDEKKDKNVEKGIGVPVEEKEEEVKVKGVEDILRNLEKSRALKGLEAYEACREICKAMIRGGYVAIIEKVLIEGEDGFVEDYQCRYHTGGDPGLPRSWKVITPDCELLDDRGVHLFYTEP